MKMLKIFFCLCVSFLCVTSYAFAPVAKTQSKSIVEIENAVANLTLITHNGEGEGAFLLPNLGHSFFMVENVSSEDIFVFNYCVKPNEKCTISTWCIKGNFGVWIDVESAYINAHNKYDGRISVEKQIDAEDLEKINKYIQKNNTWNVFKNCSAFSVGVWNTVAKQSEQLFLDLIPTPTKVAKEIKKFENYKTNVVCSNTNNFRYFKNAKYNSFNFKEVA